MAKTFKVVGSHGEITVDMDSGVPLEYKDYADEGEDDEDSMSYRELNITKFDLPLYTKTYGTIVEGIDILELGYWYNGDDGETKYSAPTLR